MTVTTIPVESYEDAEDHVAEHAPDAEELPLITAHLDADLHTVWLDRGTGTVWHAWREDLAADWTLESEPAAEAQGWIEENIAAVLDSLADPETAARYLYPSPDTSVDEDLDVLAEFEAVQLAALNTLSDDPVLVDQSIRAHIGRLTAEISRLARLRGLNLAAAYGTEHGSATRAAQALGVSHSATSRAMAAPGEYAARACAGYEKARQQRELL
ncbi:MULTISPECIES: helix-turn-helix domain-containing protein [unclassified Streptomyces]|uniref:helix-turn-helix domain-containing protein n=1 Tax=unclassified Streptomyces TaxID=2593676 RepID=UPI000BACE6FC|nr:MULTISPECIES: LysR family transcriptional regulator [unclassified Streptomyces]ASY37012.1 hypothetical protein CAC01_30715 [Streptomyces sp. CLI2509]MYX24192.1 hypothetical protein [Streptomyces sp. SID8380]